MANKKKKKIESFDQLANMQQRKRPAQSQEEPAISSMLDEFEMWMALNWKKAIIGVCAFAVVVSIIIIIQSTIQRAELKARNELANAVGIAELENAIGKHLTNKAADFARIQLASEFITSGRPEDLEKGREQLLAVAASTKSEMFIRMRAAINAAYILEKQGKPEDAALELEKIVTLTSIPGGGCKGQVSVVVPEDLRVEAAYSAARIFSSLDQTMKADAMLKNINLAAPAAQGVSTVYGYWASLACQLDEAIHQPQTAAPAAQTAEKPAEEAPAAQAEPADEAPAAQTAEKPAEDAAPQPLN